MSTGFSCFWSNGDVEATIEENHQTILHSLWTKEHFCPEGRLSGYRIAWSAGAYLLGMIGYLADTIHKIVLAIGNTLALLPPLITRDSKWLKERSVICLDTWAALGIAIIGILLPPLAYHLDAKAQEAFTRLATKVI